jgi:hypothetical protein
MIVDRVVGLALAGSLATAAAGCQTFVGLEDVEGHLPRLDGDYLIAIRRLRADAITEDTIKLRGSARLDVDRRSLDLSLSVLKFSDNTPFTETAITNITFEPDGTDAPFMLNIAVPIDAVNPVPPPASADQTLTAAVVFTAEDDYSFCARPASGARPTVGSLLLASPGATLPAADADCDVPLP